MTWTRGPAAPRFDVDEVHLWHVRLPSDAPAHAYAVLGADERARAARFLSVAARAQYVTTRGALRILLSRYLGVAPSGLAFNENQFGKPQLAGPPHRDAIRFNVSHSGGVALIALTRHRDVGVDVEEIRPAAALEIGARLFAPSEQAALMATEDRRRVDAFFACWTRKEAFVKAVGLGLHFPLATFTVSVDPASPALLATDPPEVRARWSMWDATPAPGYAGALVVEGTDCRVRRWAFDSPA